MDQYQFTAVAAPVAGALIMAGALVYLSSRREGGRGLVNWAVGIALLALHEAVVFSWHLLVPEQPPSLIAVELLHLLGALMLYSGTRAFHHNRSEYGLLWIAGVAGLGWLAITEMFALPIRTAAIPFHFLVAGVIVGAGVDLLRNAAAPKGPARWVAGALLLWGGSTAVMGFVAVGDSLMAIRLLNGELFSLLVAVGLVILAQTRQGEMLEEARAKARDAELAAAERASHFRGMLDSLPFGVVAIDADGRTTDFNPTAEAIFGFTAQEILGRDAGMMLPVHGEAPPVPGGAIGHLSEQGEPGAISEVTGIRKDGTRVPLEISVRSLDIGRGSLRFCLVRDVTESRLTSQLDQFLHGLYRRALRFSRMDELERTVCTQLSEILGVPLVFMVRHDAHKTLTFATAAGPDVSDEDVAALERLPDLLPEENALVEAARSGTTATEGPSGAAAQALPVECRWLMALPLWEEGQIAALLCVAGNGGAPTGDTLRRLESVAARISAARQTVRDQLRLRLQGTAMAAAANAIFITDSSGCIEWVNEAFTRLSGYAAEDVIGQTPAILQAGSEEEESYRRLWETIHAGRVWRGEVVARRKDGTLYTVDQTVVPILDDDGKPAHFVMVHEDITERKRAEERVRYLSNYDTLTRLPNRVLFRDHLYQSVAQARNAHSQLAVLFIDLDQFSRVNDTLGHEVGDQMLMTVASRINAVAAPYADTVARLSGDEFALIQSRLPNADAAAILARKVIEAVHRPVDLDGLEVRVGANVGIAIFPQDGEDPDHLIKNADMAMYRAIRSESEDYCFFSNEMNAEARIRLGLEGDLRHAIANGGLTLYYQPQVNVQTRRIVGVEALLRWNHPEHGWLSPARFIPIAEETGLIIPIGDWVMEEALRQCRAWRDAGLPPITVAVNISALQFQRRDLVSKVEQALEVTGTEPSMLELELTESMLMVDAQSAVEMLRALSDLGVQLAIDDFGTGYSSLSYLKQFPVHKLKLDQSFVRHMLDDQNDKVIARATINLGHSLGLRVIAEGVEQEAQFSYLRDEGADEVQGFLFGRPVPADDLARMLGEEMAAESGPAR